MHVKGRGGYVGEDGVPRLNVLDVQKQIRSLLDDIKGIGEVRKKALMRRFGDIDHIRVAGLEELRDCPSMDEYSARQVYDFFHSNPETAVGTWRAGVEEKQ